MKPGESDSGDPEDRRLTRGGRTRQRSDMDLDGQRRALVEAPGLWAPAYRRAFLRQLRKAVPTIPYLSAMAEGRALVAAPLRFRPETRGLPPIGICGICTLPGPEEHPLAAVDPAAQKPGSGTTAILSARLTGERGVQGAGFPSRQPIDEEHQLADLSVAALDLPLVRSRLLLFGDDEGLWCLAENEQGLACDARVLPVHCADATRARVTGWHAQVPFVGGFSPKATEPRHPSTNGTGSVRFRPGPLRSVLGATVRHGDRAYSPRAYAITTGESVLRGLLGWHPHECIKALNRAALEAGIKTFGELRTHILTLVVGQSSDELSRAMAGSWIGNLPITPEVREACGASCLAEFLKADGWSRLPAALLGAEIDTLTGLFDTEIAPVDGDIFVLLPTDTGTSLLGAALVSAWLRRSFPGGSFRARFSQALRQREALRRPDGRVEDRHDRPAGSLFHILEEQDSIISRLLFDAGADVVAVVSAGVKWQSLPLLESARVRRIPCVYKPGDRSDTEAAPIIFRWDRFDPARMTPVSRSPAKDAQPCLVLNAGLSLRSAFLRINQAAQDPTQDALVEWARTFGDEAWRLCGELTAFESWLAQTGRPAKGSTVALLRSASQEGRRCAEAIAVLLSDRGVRALQSPEWEVLELSGAPRGEVRQLQALAASVGRPIRSCLDTLLQSGYEPAVVVSTGQRLVGDLLHFLAAAFLGLPTYIVPDPDEGADPPPLWLVPTPYREIGMDDIPIE